MLEDLIIRMALGYGMPKKIKSCHIGVLNVFYSLF